MLQGPELLSLTVKDVGAYQRHNSPNHRGRTHTEETAGPMRLVQDNSKDT